MFIYFLPKENIYFFMEEGLNEQKVILSSEKIEDKGFYLNIKDIDLSYEMIQSAHIKDSNINFFILYNSIDASDIMISESLSKMMPTNIKNVSMSYTIFNPLKIDIKSSGEFGEVSGYIDLSDKKITLKLLPSKLMKNRYRSALNNFKKNKEGEYIYEQNI
jgi:hypothetical protein